MNTYKNAFKTILHNSAMIYLRIFILVVLAFSFTGCSTIDTQKWDFNLEDLTEDQNYQVRVRTGNLAIDKLAYKEVFKLFSKHLPVSTKGPYSGFIELSFTAVSQSLIGTPTPAYQTNVRYGNSWYTGGVSDSVNHQLRNEKDMMKILSWMKSETNLSIKDVNGRTLWDADYFFKGGEDSAFVLIRSPGDSAKHSIQKIAHKFTTDFPYIPAGIIIKESDGSTSVAETGTTTDTYSIALTKAPKGIVTINVKSSDSATGVNVDMTNLTFDNTTWNTPQTLTVTAVNDNLSEATPHFVLINHYIDTSLTKDNRYISEKLPLDNIKAGITDNDSVGISITESNDSTDVDETGSSTDYYDVVLTSQPLGDVTVKATSADPVTGVKLANSHLTFNSDTWDIPQSLTLTAADDDLFEGTPHTTTIKHSIDISRTTDTDYAALSGDFNAVTVQITDNDSARLVITETEGSTVVNETGSTSDTYTIALTNQPNGIVVIRVKSTDPATGVIVNTDKLTFNIENWSKPQTLTVTAVSDNMVEGSPHTAMLTHSIDPDRTTDIDYLNNKEAFDSVKAVITDAKEKKRKKAFPIALVIRSRWSVAGKNSHGHTVYTDSHTVTRTSPNILKVWTKATLGESSFLDLIEVDCKENDFRVLERKLDNNPSLSSSLDSWNTISPESTPELIFKSLCPEHQP